MLGGRSRLLPGNRCRRARVDLELGGEEQRTIPALVDRRRTRTLVRPSVSRESAGSAGNDGSVVLLTSIYILQRSEMLAAVQIRFAPPLL